MVRNGELGEFLKSRRVRRQPEDVGVRFRSGQDPDDARLHALIDTLRKRSPECGRLRSAHLVTDLTHGETRLHPPKVGPPGLDDATLSRDGR
ncbi:hypothetical protein [Actinomadura rubrisoli]|uniref:MmyB-like transcription regulator ligand binding domain-containing protein n=1 Tax=Actinomadura rubrisoli TaxID=2530368 RepID=A0A4R5C121_9ACTN|nr:hypothetical protein [Actinomadura rubrisoli]TDD91713.1 hypothetical protein E1298_11615 [Actinomadura rubrisoli]